MTARGGTGASIPNCRWKGSEPFFTAENAVEENHGGLIFTNLQVFYKITKEAYVSMNEDIISGRIPKPGGEPGWIITYDPDQKCFKNALITIVFCGVWLESLLHLLIVDRKSIEIFKKYDQKSLEDKIQLLGCDDQSIIDLCEHFRKIRREIVHEKAHLDFDKCQMAEKEAKKAMDLITKVCAHFKIEMDK